MLPRAYGQQCPGRPGRAWGAACWSRSPSATWVRSDRSLRANCRDLGCPNRLCWCSGALVNFSLCRIKPQGQDAGDGACEGQFVPTAPLLHTAQRPPDDSDEGSSTKFQPKRLCPPYAPREAAGHRQALCFAGNSDRRQLKH